MQKMNLTTNAAPTALTVGTGQPMRPATTGQPIADRKNSDPSSTAPKGLPAFFEHRIKAREYDPL